MLMANINKIQLVQQIFMVVSLFQVIQMKILLFIFLLL